MVEFDLRSHAFRQESQIKNPALTSPFCMYKGSIALLLCIILDLFYHVLKMFFLIDFLIEFSHKLVLKNSARGHKVEKTPSGRKERYDGISTR